MKFIKKNLAKNLQSSKDKKKSGEILQNSLYTEIKSSNPPGSIKALDSAGKAINDSIDSEERKTIQSIFFDADDIKSTGIEDGNLVRLEFIKLGIIDLLTGICSILGLVIIVLAYEVEFSESNSDRLEFLLWTLLFTTIFTIFCNFLRHQQQIKFFKAKLMISKDENIFSSGQIYYFIFEAIILLLQPYPFCSGIQVHMYNRYLLVDYYYYVNDFLVMLSVFRVYIILRCYLNSTQFLNPSAKRLCNIYGADNNYLFSIRCLLKLNPLMFSFWLMGGIIVVFGFILRVSERPLDRTGLVSFYFTNLADSMWCVILTITTIGYGDIFARTEIGRLITFITCLAGVAVVSLMVVNITNVLKLENSEQRTLDTIMRLKLREELESEAAFILTGLAKLSFNLNKNKVYDQNFATKLQAKFDNFRSIQRNIALYSCEPNMSEQLHREFKLLKYQFEEYKERLKNLETDCGYILQTFIPNKRV